MNQDCNINYFAKKHQITTQKAHTSEMPLYMYVFWVEAKPVFFFLLYFDR